MLHKNLPRFLSKDRLNLNLWLRLEEDLLLSGEAADIDSNGNRLRGGGGYHPGGGHLLGDDAAAKGGQGGVDSGESLSLNLNFDWSQRLNGNGRHSLYRSHCFMNHMSNWLLLLSDGLVNDSGGGGLVDNFFNDRRGRGRCNMFLNNMGNRMHRWRWQRFVTVTAGISAPCWQLLNYKGGVVVDGSDRVMRRVCKAEGFLNSNGNRLINWHWHRFGVGEGLGGIIGGLLVTASGIAVPVLVTVTVIISSVTSTVTAATVITASTVTSSRIRIRICVGTNGGQSGQAKHYL